jgi:hypothetical protein
MAQVKARLELKHSDAQFGKKRGTRWAKDGVNPSAERHFTWAAQELKDLLQRRVWGRCVRVSIPESPPQQDFDHRDSQTHLLLVTEQRKFATSTQVVGLPVERDLRTGTSMRTELVAD